MSSTVTRPAKTATGEATSPISPEDVIYGLRTAGTPRISPDGTRIVYALSQTDQESGKGHSQLWLCNRDGGNATQLTRAGNRHSDPQWSPDGERLAFVADRGPDGHPAVCVLPLDGGEAEVLTAHAQSITSLAWSPDGAILAYTTSVDPENLDETPREHDAPPKVRVVRRIDYKQDNRGYLNDVRQQVFVLDVATGDRHQLTKEPFDHVFPQWSPDGKTIAAKLAKLNGMASQLTLVDVASGETTLVGQEEGSVGVWAWSNDGSFILFSADNEHLAQQDFYRYDVASGEIKRLTDDLDISPESGFPTISGPAQPVWLDDQTALIHAIHAGASGLYTVNADSGAVEIVQRWDATRNGLSVDSARRYAVQGSSSLDGTGEVAVYALQTDETAIVTHVNDDFFAAHPLAGWEKIAVTRAGIDIDAWVLTPPDLDEADSYPVILDVHGGPHGNYGYIFNAGQQVLATNGFIVVASNPRGSGSYGREFAGMVHGDWGGEDFKDLMAVVDEVLKRPYADEKRTGIYGYSYGGYMTAWTISQTDRFQAAVCGAPCFDLVSMYGTSDISHVFGEVQWHGTPWENKERLVAMSPATYAHHTTTPTLIVQGEADDRCPIGQGEQMFVTLHKAGVDVEFVRYPGGSHLMLRGGPAEHRVDYYTRVLGWFQRLLQPSA